RQTPRCYRVELLLGQVGRGRGEHQVELRGGRLVHLHLQVRGDGQARLGQHGPGVAEQPLLVRLVAPGAGYHLAPLLRPFLPLRVLYHGSLLPVAVDAMRWYRVAAHGAISPRQVLRRVNAYPQVMVAEPPRPGNRDARNSPRPAPSRAILLACT